MIDIPLFYYVVFTRFPYLGKMGYLPDEVVNEAYLRIYQNTNNLSDYNKIYYAIIDWLRTQKYLDTVEVDVESIPSSDNVLDNIILKEQANIALSCLSPKYRRVVVEYIMNGENLSTVSEVEGITKSGVVHRIKRAIPVMRKALKQQNWS